MPPTKRLIRYACACKDCNKQWHSNFVATPPKRCPRCQKTNFSTKPFDEKRVPYSAAADAPDD